MPTQKRQTIGLVRTLKVHDCQGTSTNFQPLCSLWEVETFGSQRKNSVPRCLRKITAYFSAAEAMLTGWVAGLRSAPSGFYFFRIISGEEKVSTKGCSLPRIT